MGDKKELECRLTEAFVGNSTDSTCSLDMQTLSFGMKEIGGGVFVGASVRGDCFNTILTINRNSKRVSLSFERSRSADSFERIRKGMCGIVPRTQMLMNCGALVEVNAKKITGARIL